MKTSAALVLYQPFNWTPLTKSLILVGSTGTVTLPQRTCPINPGHGGAFLSITELELTPQASKIQAATSGARPHLSLVKPRVTCKQTPKTRQLSDFTLHTSFDTLPSPRRPARRTNHKPAP